MNMQTDKLGFSLWMRKVSAHAMSFEWCIDEDMPKWEDWFNQGIAPMEAVQKLFAIVREE